MGATVTRNPTDGGVTPRDPADRGRGEIRFFSVAAVAAFLGVSVRTVRRWIRRGDLVAHHFGTAVRVAERDLKAFIARQRDS
jgi:excisionase family DNA binding protein